MATLRPFRGCRFNPAVVGDLSAVVCPPYDMIGPELKTQLQQRSAYNAVHLEGGEQPDPVDPQAGYQQAARLFQQWLGDGALLRDDEPGFYLMRHAYDFNGARYQHLGFFADVLVEDYDAGAVYPHEFTREPAVLDRVALLDACQAQFSPIMSLYQDADGDLQRIFDAVIAGTPDASAVTPAGGNAQLWRISDEATQAALTETFANRPVFLADGHHRYEAALRYSRNQAGTGAHGADAASNYVMMTLIEFDDPGLLLLPYHRVVGGLSAEQLDGVLRRLYELFDARSARATDAGSVVAEVAELGADRHCFAMYAADGSATIHTLKPGVDWPGLGVAGAGFRSRAGRRAGRPRGLQPGSQRHRWAGQPGRTAAGHPVEALPIGTLPGDCQRRPAAASQVHLLLSQAAHRPGHQSAFGSSVDIWGEWPQSRVTHRHVLRRWPRRQIRAWIRRNLPYHAGFRNRAGRRAGRPTSRGLQPGSRCHRRAGQPGRTAAGQGPVEALPIGT